MNPAYSRHGSETDPKHDVGHVNPAYSRHGSETDSNTSDMDNRDISPPRVRRARGGRDNLAFSSDSSYKDSSSVDDERVEGYSVEDETFSQKEAREQDILDGRRSDRWDRDKTDGRCTRTGKGRRSRRDEFKRNPRSDSPLTIETLEKHENITRAESDKNTDISKRNSIEKEKSRRREPSPSQDSSLTQKGSLVTDGTEHIATTVGSRFEKNPKYRRNSPSRSSSHRHYRTRHHRSGSGERNHHRSSSNEVSHRDRSRSSGGSSRSRRSNSSGGSGSRLEATKLNKQQAVLPIFSDPKGKKSKSSTV